MRIPFLRVLLVLVNVAIINPVIADQKIKTKSNIKNDRVQQPATSEGCSNEAGVVVDCVKSEEDKSAAQDADVKKSQQVDSASSEGAKDASTTKGH
jgi:hypothetical protein